MMLQLLQSQMMRLESVKILMKGLRLLKKIVEHAADYGIKPEDVVVDPLVMPIGAICTGR